jgi:lipopolysaccharide assembly outer membrane protein LptD (OstA)
MTLRRWLLLLAASAGLAATPARAQQPASPWFIEAPGKEGNLTFELATRTVIATNGIVVRYRESPTNSAELTALRARLNQESGHIAAEGSVTLKRDGQLWRSERIEYNFITRDFRAEQFRTGHPPLFTGGLTLAADGTNRVFAATDATFTTDDLAVPGVRIKCRTLTVVPGERIEATEATVYLGRVPIFYLPKFARSLERHPNNLVLTPGYRSLYGPFLLGTYNWTLSDELNGRLHLDWRQRRGFGFGPDVNYNLGPWGAGEFKFYYAHDDEPGLSLAGKPVATDRHRISISHAADVRTNLTVRLTLREQRDDTFIRDFFESEYQKNIQPSSFAEVNQLWPNFSLNVLAQPRINDFYESVERLPDVKLSAIRQQVGVTPVFYESESSAGYFRHKFVNGTSNDVAALRADTYHQLTLPQTWFGFLNVTPRVGGRFTHYGEREGAGVPTVEADRAVFNTGAEFSFKASRLWEGVRSPALDLDGVRHIVEPSINYAFVPRPDRTPLDLPQFDTELPGLRLLPIEFPDYNSIDSVDSQNVLRLGLRNRVQTRRAGQLDHVVNWALYTDWRLKPRAGQTTFADVFSDLDIKPRSWLTLSSESRYDIATGHFRLADHNLAVEPNTVWSFALGHRYLRSDPALGTNGLGNNLIRSSIHYRLSENWGLRATQHFEARNGRMQDQGYSLYHDFRSWTGALTVRLRDNVGAGRSDFTIGFVFSFKAFPRFGLGQDRDAPSLLFGN